MNSVEFSQENNSTEFNSYINSNNINIINNKCTFQPLININNMNDIYNIYIIIKTIF